MARIWMGSSRSGVELGGTSQRASEGRYTILRSKREQSKRRTLGQRVSAQSVHRRLHILRARRSQLQINKSEYKAPTHIMGVDGIRCVYSYVKNSHRAQVYYASPSSDAHLELRQSRRVRRECEYGTSKYPPYPSYRQPPGRKRRSPYEKRGCGRKQGRFG